MEAIAIRTIQHYLYCPHRWGLLEIDCAWAENSFVVKANMLHERAHSGGNYTSRGKEVYTDVSVWNDEFAIYGKLDCLEKVKNSYCIVEYKPTTPADCDYRHEDAMQVFAQKLCADSVFGCSCDAAIYYSDKKKRVALPFSAEYDLYLDELKSVLAEMRNNLQNGVIPPKRRNQNCNGCSMKDLCMPSALKVSKRSLAADIAALLEGEL